MNKNNFGKLFILILGVIILLFGLVFFENTNNDSKIKSEEDIEKYLNEKYAYESFKIENKKERKVKVTGGVGSKCNYKGYSWTVKSEKNGVKFEVYDEITIFVINSDICNRGIADNYVDSIYESIKKEYNLKNGEYNHSFIINKSSFNNLEELANYIYGIITKYNLNKEYFDFVIQLNDKNSSKTIELRKIQSKDDLINNYL